MKRRTGQKMRKKIKESPIRFRITAAMCLSAAAILLGGCSLAVPGAGTEEAGDRLIGLFITPESLDLYDTEGYLQDHGAQLMNQMRSFWKMPRTMQSGCMRTLTGRERRIPPNGRLRLEKCREFVFSRRYGRMKTERPIGET